MDRDLGDAGTVSDGKIIAGRDKNGARGIMLRALCGNSGRLSGGERGCRARCGTSQVQSPLPAGIFSPADESGFDDPKALRVI